MAFSVTRASHPGLFDAIFLAPRGVSRCIDRCPSIDRYRSVSITCIDVCVDEHVDARIDRCRDEEDVDDGGGDGSARRVDRIVTCAWDRDEG